jgi:hypothetical protein
MTIRHGICRNAIGCARDGREEDLALRRGQFSGKLNLRFQRAVAELCEIMGFSVVSRARRKQRIKSFLPLRIRLNTDVFTVGVAKTVQRLN